MTDTVNKLVTTFLELQCDDEASIDEFAQSLNLTSDEVRAAIEFGREILQVGINQRRLTNLQVLQAAMGAVMVLVKNSGSPEEQREHCGDLFSDMMNYCDGQPIQVNGRRGSLKLKRLRKKQLQEC